MKTALKMKLTTISPVNTKRFTWKPRYVYRTAPRSGDIVPPKPAAAEHLAKYPACRYKSVTLPMMVFVVAMS